LLVGCDYVAWGQSGGSTCPSVAGDPHGHGTHVAGIVAAAQGNGVGVSGVAPQVTVLVIRVLDETGSGYVSDTADAIRYAADTGARVINLSLGSGASSAYERAAIEYAQARGVLIVASAGNGYQNGNRTNYPAAYPGVLAVGASTVDDARAPYSNTGAYVGLVAPGGYGSSADGRAISSLYPVAKGSYAALNGTSMAAPHVAGAAGLLFSLRPDLTGEDASAILRSTARPLGGAVPNPEFGYGRLDLAAALRSAQTFGATAPAATPTRTATPSPSPTPTWTPTATATGTATPPAPTSTPPALRESVRLLIPVADR
jgi:subtilisin family serine protease